MVWTNKEFKLMKYEMYRNGGDYIRYIEVKGLVLTSFIQPSNETYDGKFLIRKEYADAAFTNIPLTKLTGTLNYSAIYEGITGDLVGLSGGNIKLKTIISPMTVFSPVVNSKGLVVSGSAFNINTLPDIPYSKLYNKPITAGGYGITDALLTTGGTVTGNITLPTPTEGNHAGIKSHIDDFIDDITTGSLPIGALKRRCIKLATPTGYLQCNGGILSRAMYPALFGVIGTKYDTANTDVTKFSLPNLLSTENGYDGYYIKY